MTFRTRARSPASTICSALSGSNATAAFATFACSSGRAASIAAMMRHAPHWITNVKRGGRPVAVVPDHAMHELALRAAAAVGAESGRRRHSVRCRRSADRARGQQHAGVVRTADGDQREYRFRHRFRDWSDLSRRARHKERRGDHARLRRSPPRSRPSCLDELDAPKPGNVHAFAPGHRMTAAQFERSAAAAAAPIAQAGARVGARIEAAVAATFAAVGVNTNLGIILLCAPLAAAAERGSSDLHGALAAVLDDLDIEDARRAFSAIVRAAPAGLGRAEQHDVFAPPTVTLREAMAAAAHRDRIARQYVSGFADIFEIGEANLVRALASTVAPALGNAGGLHGFSGGVPRQPHRAQTWSRAGARRAASTRQAFISACNHIHRRRICSPSC